MSWQALSDETRALFDRLLAEYPGAVIAGGAVRDALLGYPISDVDLWIDVASGVELGLESDSSAAEYEVMDQVGRVVAVLKAEHEWCPYPVHVMLVTMYVPGRVGVTAAVDRFDYGLCKVGYDGEVVLTSDFLRDLNARRLTLLNEAYTSPARYEKLKAKFEGWEIDAPKSVEGGK